MALRQPSSVRVWRLPAPVRAALATAAVVAVAVLGIYTWGLNRQVVTLQAEARAQAEQIVTLNSENMETAAVVADLRATVDALRAERNQLMAEASQLAGANANLNRQLLQLNRELALDQSRLQLLSTASAAVMLDEGDAAPQSRGTFYVSGPQGVLIVHGLKPLPESQIYQFWWVTADGAQVPVAPIEVRADVEPTWAVFDVPAQAPPFSVVGLSIEPAGGSPQPTGPMVLEGSANG